MWGRTFGFVNMVYLMMYCCFVCAGVDVILLRVGNDGIKQEGLEILEAASSQGPGASFFHFPSQFWRRDERKGWTGLSSRRRGGASALKDLGWTPNRTSEC